MWWSQKHQARHSQNTFSLLMIGKSRSPSFFQKARWAMKEEVSLCPAHTRPGIILLSSHLPQFWVAPSPALMCIWTSCELVSQWKTTFHCIWQIVMHLPYWHYISKFQRGDWIFRNSRHYSDTDRRKNWTFLLHSELWSGGLSVSTKSSWVGILVPRMVIW